MGLDLIAYSGLVNADGDVERGEDGEIRDYDDVVENYFYASPAKYDFTEHNWPGRAAPILRDTVYSWTKEFQFSAGAYGVYAEFRDFLAQLAGFKDRKDYWTNATPESDFYELVKFADNEGIIGSTAAAELVKDFVKHQQSVDQHGGYAGAMQWYKKSYGHWRQACEMAADGGAIDFH